MNQLIEKLSNFSLSPNYYEDMRNFMLSICSKYGVNERTATPFVIVILGCLCLFIYVSNRRPRLEPRNPDHAMSSPRPKTKSYDRTRSWIVSEIHSGKPILDRLKEDFNKARVNPATLANTEKVLKALLKEEHLDLMKLQLCCNELKQTVAKLEMSGSEDSAVRILDEAVKKTNGANKPHQAYEIEMLLVEMLIYKGDLETALNCECVKDESLKDARRPLYKAIIYQMQGNRNKNLEKSREQIEKTKDYWEEFLAVRDPALEGDSHPNFDSFEKNVDRLQKAIDEFAGRNEQKNLQM